MAIIIKGDNNGIAVDGNLTIEKLDFVFGQGVRSASGVSRDIPEAEVVEAEEVPVVDGRDEVHYPEITDVNTDFFTDTFFVTSEVIGVPRKRLEVPKVEILHIIYNSTREWNPSDRASHKWRVLYEVLRRLTYFTIGEKHRFSAFVEAVVKYCFPNDVPAGYANNISKSKLEEHFEDWSLADKDLYKTLKTALTFAK
ncbi:MAG: hypothetical protein KBT20_06455 [Bacteroidales bacterium]|nr:hypothetical protein [Candidatus Liminaster caballi]